MAINLHRLRSFSVISLQSVFQFVVCLSIYVSRSRKDTCRNSKSAENQFK